MRLYADFPRGSLQKKLSFPCHVPYVYIGEIGRTLKKRLTEHKAELKKFDNKNGIAVHAWKSGHQVEWESVMVKAVVPNLAHRKITKALHIHQTPNTTNLDCGLTSTLPVFFSLHDPLSPLHFIQPVLCITQCTLRHLHLIMSPSQFPACS